MRKYIEQNHFRKFDKREYKIQRIANVFTLILMSVLAAVIERRCHGNSGTHHVTNQSEQAERESDRLWFLKKENPQQDQ